MTKTLIALVLFTTGCATVTAPTNECRITTMDGSGRYGTFTQYVGGDAQMVRVVEAGTGCPYYEVTTKNVKMISNQ